MTNSDQLDLWAREGDHWVREADRYDAMNRRFGEAMLDAARLGSGREVLDVGCGNGATTLSAARRVAPRGTVTGIDISRPMLSLAGRRANESGADNVDLVEGDAQIHPFEEGTYDAVISRFGTMFFDDPVAAFTNLHRSIRPEGRLAIVCWTDMSNSEWIFVPGAAASEHVGFPDFGPPGSPGPFAFADEDRLRHVLESGGFRDVIIEELTEPMRIGDDADDAIAFITSLELVRDNLFAGKPAEDVAAAVEAARDALVPYESPDGVVMDGGAWLVTGQS